MLNNASLEYNKNVNVGNNQIYKKILLQYIQIMREKKGNLFSQVRLMNLEKLL